MRVRVRSTRLQTPTTEAAFAAVAGQREAAVEVEECGAALRALEGQQRVHNVSPGMVDLQARRQQQRQQQQHPNKQQRRRTVEKQQEEQKHNHERSGAAEAGMATSAVAAVAEL